MDGERTDDEKKALNARIKVHLYFEKYKGWHVQVVQPGDIREVSEGGMYRPQWSWDLKMCPY